MQAPKQILNPKASTVSHDGGAGDLAQQIEHENQKLRDKNMKIKQQLAAKQQQMQNEKMRYAEKIRRLREKRDLLME